IQPRSRVKGSAGGIMAVALAVTSIRTTRRHHEVEFKPTMSGNYAAGGDTLDFTAATDAAFKGFRKPSVAPEAIEANGSFGGHTVTPIVGAAANNSKLKFFTAPNTELAAAAYPAAITGDDDNCRIVARWKKGTI